MLYNNMDLSNLMVHVEKLEDNRKKRESMMIGGLTLMIRKVLTVEATETILRP